jgi:excisionase family DNA binding protein
MGHHIHSPYESPDAAAKAAVANRERRQLETLDAAARRLSVDQRTIRRRIADGTITGYRVAGRKAIRVDAAEVDEKLLTPIPTIERSA